MHTRRNTRRAEVARSLYRSTFASYWGTMSTKTLPIPPILTILHLTSFLIIYSHLPMLSIPASSTVWARPSGVIACGFLHTTATTTTSVAAAEEPSQGVLNPRLSSRMENGRRICRREERRPELDILSAPSEKVSCHLESPETLALPW